MSDKSPAWKDAERIVAMVEKALSPDAKVEHDVSLPVLGADRKRQCDVVITYGSGLRKSVAIVEVQKRGEKPDITTFHGWYRKMQEVGAQQLFCVSAVGFPQSIIDEVAQRIGPTVTLLTMSDVQVWRPGGFFISPIAFTTIPRFTIRHLGSVKLRGKLEKSDLEISTTDKRFSVGKENELLSLNELLAAKLGESLPIENTPPHEPPPPSRDLKMEITDKDNWWLCDDSGRLQITFWDIDVQIDYERTQYEIAVNSLEYRQEKIGGALAWIGKAALPNGTRVTIVAIPHENGTWTFSVNSVA